MERKEMLMTLMIVVLLATTAMQTVALASMGSGNTVRTMTSTPTSGSEMHETSSGSGSSLSDLPSMVGGC